MKKIILLALLATSICFGQKHKPKHKNNHGHHNNHHNHHVQKPSHNFWFGVAILDAITGNNNNNNYYHDYGWNNNSVMEMHFRYVPRRDEWVLERKRRHVQATYFLDYGKPRIVATFENPIYNNNEINHDYNIIIHRDGYWEYDCPESLRRYFTRKVKNNIQRWR